MSQTDQPHHQPQSGWLREAWRGLWGRGSGLAPSATRLVALDQWLQPGSDANAGGCVICARRIEACHHWLRALPPGQDITGSNGLVYCPRHCRFLLDDPGGREHLLADLPALLSAARTNLLAAPGHRARHQASLPACPPCQVEHETETVAVRAAATAPTNDTGLVQGLTHLPLCHEHTIRVATRMVGHLGPEPRAIPDLHVLLASHRRRLRHLTDRDPQLPVAQVLAESDDDAPRRAAHRPALALLRGPADPDAATTDLDPGWDAGTVVNDDDNGIDDLRACDVCTPAVDDTRVFLLDLLERLVRSDSDRARQLSLCSAHLYDLIGLADITGASSVNAVTQAAARAHLLRLAPVLDWLDSAFVHPHTVRAAIAELAQPLPCLACSFYREAQRHAAADLTVRVPHLAPVIPEAVCYRDAGAVPVGHTARERLIDELRRAEHFIRQVSASGAGPTTTTATGHVWTAALALLDGRIHTDIAGVDNDAPTL